MALKLRGNTMCSTKKCTLVGWSPRIISGFFPTSEFLIKTRLLNYLLLGELIIDSNNNDFKYSQ